MHYRKSEVLNLATQFHCQDTAFPHALPRKRKEHSALHQKALPRAKLTELKLTARMLVSIVFRTTQLTIIIISDLILSLFLRQYYVVVSGIERFAREAPMQL